MTARPAAAAVVTLLAVLVATLVTAARPAAAASPAEVESAIARGKKFLFSLQRPEGRWEPDAQRKGTSHHDHTKMQGGAWGGFTAIATYALLASGENPQDPRLAKAIHFLKAADITGVYSLGMRAQVWTLLPPTAETRALAKRDATTLLATLNINGPGKGGWDYDDPTNQGKNPNGGRIDHSVSQYGVLGLWAAARCGYEVPAKTWETLDATWRAHQFSDGGWNYDGDSKGAGSGQHEETASMTAAGVATLFITQDYLRANEGLGCQGNVVNENIDKGLAWIGEHFNQVHENNYAWYGVERIGVASGYKYFGSKDWYALGAEELVRRQRPDGSWDGGYAGATPIPTTAFALLFLSRGRAPVIMNKLDYTPLAATPTEGAAPASAKLPKVVAHWNQRPRDVANLAGWMATQTERDLNWQIVNLSAAPEDLHDAPILYIAGSQTLQLSDADAGKLRAFVEQGGMILGNGDCGKEVFNKSFRKLGRQLFPKYEFRDLPANHVIYKEQQYDADRWKNRPKVQGLSNGVRELMLLVPDADPARAWQTRMDRAREELFQLGANVFLYAVDKKNLQYKGETFFVKDKGVEPAATLKVARLMVGDNPDPEPGGWRRLNNVLRNERKLAVSTEPVSLGGGGLGAFKIAHLTGTTAFKLDAVARKELADFVNAGGTLVVDAAGGATPFAESAETELGTVLGAAAAKGMARPLPPDHALYTQAGAKLDRFGYRRFARKIVGESRAPRVKGIKAGDRVAVFYSRDDLSAGLVGEPVDGIVGYDAATATAVMRNILLYAQSGGNVKPGEPSTTAATPPGPKPAGPFEQPGQQPKEPAKKPGEPAAPVPF